MFSETPLTTSTVEIEDGGVVTLPDAALRHLGIEPGVESKVTAELENGNLVLRRAPD